MAKVKCGIAPLKPGERYGTWRECENRGQIGRYGQYGRTLYADAVARTREKQKKREEAAKKAAILKRQEDKRIFDENLRLANEFLGDQTLFERRRDKADEREEAEKKRRRAKIDRLRIKKSARSYAKKALQDIAAVPKQKILPDVRYSLGIASFDNNKASAIANELLRAKQASIVVSPPKQPNRSLSAAAFKDRGWEFIYDYGEFLKHKLSNLTAQQKSVLLYTSKRGKNPVLNYINKIIPSFAPSRAKFWDQKAPSDYIWAIVKEYLP